MSFKSSASSTVFIWFHIVYQFLVEMKNDFWLQLLFCTLEKIAIDDFVTFSS